MALDVPDECAKDEKCTICAKLNVIYDQTVNRGRGLTPQQKRSFEQGQIAKARQDYAVSNIKLDVTYTAGSYTVGPNGQPLIKGVNPDALNLVISSVTRCTEWLCRSIWGRQDDGYRRDVPQFQ